MIRTRVRAQVTTPRLKVAFLVILGHSGQNFESTIGGLIKFSRERERVL